MSLAANLGTGTGSVDARQHQRVVDHESRQFLPIIVSRAEPQGGTAPERCTAATTSSAVHLHS